MKKFRKIIKTLAFALILVLASLGAAMGAIQLHPYRREDPEKQKTEMVRQEEASDDDQIYL